MICFADQDKLAEIMKIMEDHELTMERLYRFASAAWPADEPFWLHLAAMEKTHAENLGRMNSLIKAKPERFEMGRPFNTTALQTAKKGILDNFVKISQGALSKLQMLFLARDIEQSLLEARYGELVKTTDVEYQTLLKEIMGQTYEHRKMIQEQIDRTQKAS